MRTAPPPLNGPRRSDLRLLWAGALIGFALSGFFDGILLHQVLQWHHLLSGLDGPGWQDLRTQVLADGLFHLFMYVVAAVGLGLLVHARRCLQGPGSQRRLLAAALTGFGAWHLLDAVLSHWWLGLHRIRMDTAQPLLWDLGWLAAFGLVPLLAAWRLGRGPGRRERKAGRLAVLLGAVTVAAAGWATRPPPGAEDRLTLLLAPGTRPAQALAAVHAVDARIAWVDPAGTVWVLALPPGRAVDSGYRDGVLAIGGRWAAAACAGWGGS
ncbi:DUF2243 domain-containing protein [Schlegelella sp. S2-27]|uniref:DUF2243 domain-containing protein n=1 Tax=Caldimonas mangrovi TaxID=2944811 RepID=A0ABT0YNP6_9BURK|nr:DUF2243 domain-containing protein [Caldimonas mangrovi]MCM5679503.1 DUF2243 domain-containing protein [Caldimonas mangrovi]